MKRDLINTLQEKDFIISEDMWCSDDNNDLIVAAVEPTFNINKKFGLNIKKDMDVEVVFFIEYDIVSEDMLIVYYIIQDGDTSETIERQYKPTDDEKENILKIMDKYCRNAIELEKENNSESE